MTYKGTDLKTYQEIIEFGLALEGDAQKEFVLFCRTQSPFALQNIGYFAGYYDTQTAQRIYQTFGTAHPIFGTHTPTADEAFAAGQLMAKRALDVS